MSIYVCTSSRLYYNTVHSLLDTLSKVKISDSSVYIMQIEEYQQEEHTLVREEAQFTYQEWSVQVEIQTC